MISMHTLQQQSSIMKKWMTLTGYCLANYSNALSFGVYSDNLDSFADFYSTSQDSIANLFYIGLVVEIVFCLPAIRLIQWRLDYAIICSAYLTACSTLLCSFSFGNFVIVVASIFLNSIAQLFILPTCFYVAEVWFPLDERSLAIGLGFYFNLIGYASGSLLTSLMVQTSKNVRIEMIIISIISCLIMIATISIVRNKPKVPFENKIIVRWSHAKALWRNKYLAYNAVAISVFLGESWAFLASFSVIQTIFTSEDVGFLILIWILSGVTFGIFMSFVMQKQLKNTGNYIIYDRICKGIIVLGFIGNAILGFLVRYSVDTYALYATLMFFIGVGSIGFYGLVFLSLIQSLYPIPILLISTIIIVFASIYSILSLSVSAVLTQVNVYLSFSIVAILPLFYVLVNYETNLKRYRYYLNQKETRYQLLKIQEVNEYAISYSDNKSITSSKYH